MKNLELMGVQEMDANEMRNENGGARIAKIYGEDGVYFIDYDTGKVYDITGKCVYQYIGDW